jgi:leader peptidase (prepilin peptidase)/N-methyltransferase
MIVNIFMFVLGAAVGSFLNVCIHRLPQERSIVYPPSYCPHCKAKIKPYDLIPILSFIWLKGRCRKCQNKISWRYPIVEFLSGAAFVSTPLILGLPAYAPRSIFYIIFSALLLVVFFADQETQIIPDEVFYVGLPLALVYHSFFGTLKTSLAGLAIGFLVLFIIARLGKLIYKKEAVGFGDLKLAAFMGAALGWEKLIPALFIGYILGGLWASALILSRRKKISDYIPFGPALCLGAYLALFWGKDIINWYLANFI